jgi:hypothetical protein
MQEQMQEQIIPGAGAMDIGYGGILGAGVGADDDIGLGLFQNSKDLNILMQHLMVEIMGVCLHAIGSISIKVERLNNIDSRLHEANFHSSASAEITFGCRVIHGGEDFGVKVVAKLITKLAFKSNRRACEKILKRQFA